MKKYIIYIILIVFGLTGTTGCDFIDITPENALTYENAFDTPQEMEAAVSTLHSYIMAILSSSTSQEEIGMLYNGANKKEGVNLALINHDWLPQMGRAIHDWGGHYAIIGFANIIESNIKKSYPEEMYNFLIGQAEFAKAYAYYDLARAYGWAVIVPDNDSESPALPTSSPDEVLKKAEEYALKAFNHCPKYEFLHHTDGVKITNKQYASKEICAALLAYIYAWHASVPEGVSKSERQDYYKESEKYASMLIDGELKGYVSLEPTIRDLVENTLNNRHTGKESIFEVELDPKYIVSMPREPLYTAHYFFGWPYHSDIIDSTRAPRNTVSCKRILNLYGGLETNDHRLEYFFPETKRRYNSAFDKEAMKEDSLISTKKIPWGPPAWGMFQTIYIGGFPDIAPNRAFVKKFYKEFRYSNNPENPKHFVNFDVNKVVWRLADLILLRAEVRNFSGDKAGAVKDINRIRKRANAALYPAPGEENGDLQFIIFQERERELIYENHRWWDIRRNKDYYKKFLPAAYRKLTEADISLGALYYPTPNRAGEYNVKLLPNKYWFSRMN